MGLNVIVFLVFDINLFYIFDEIIKLLDEIIENKLYLEIDILNINYLYVFFKKVFGICIIKMGLRI